MTAAARRQHQRDELLTLTQRLVAVAAVEQTARVRLSAIVPAHGVG